MPIEASLYGKTARQKSDIKAVEIAKVARKKHQRSKYKIEIVDTNVIDGGVEVFAKAWDGVNQIGFGEDGSVEVERFRIFNPPILVDDPSGTIIRVTEANPVTRAPRSERRLREDPQEALLQVIEHNLSVMKNIHDDSRIQRGKIGRTTTTLYPSAGAVSPVDGRTSYGNSSGGSWNQSHDATSANGSTSSVSDTEASGQFATAYNHPNGHHIISRGFFLFDTSAIGADSIDSAIFSLYVTAISDQDNDANAFVSVVQSNPASNAAIVAADYDQCGDAVDNPTEGHDSGQRKDITGISTSAYLDWTLNSTGIGWIDGAGITKLGTREGHDILDDPLTNNGGNTTSSITGYYADQAGTSNDPKLVVTHAAAVTNFNSLMMLGVGT